MKKIRIHRKPIQFSVSSLILITSLASFLFILSEWVFHVTKPSFLNNYSFFKKFLILVNSAGMFSLACILLLFPFLFFVLVFRGRFMAKILKTLGALLPAFFITCLVLMLVDNFTYTLFKFGIVSTFGIWRSVYLVLFLILMVFFLIKVIDLANFVEEILPRNQKRPLLIGFLLLTLLAAFFPGNFKGLEQVKARSTNSGAENLPNVILITADSLNAAQMSVYGYKKDTTPFLNEIAASSLVGMNNFSNAQGTIGSVTSILTGRHPFATRILAFEDILQGEDATQHLPGILRAAGYYTVQLSDSYYADAVKINFQDAFNEANGKLLESDPASSMIARLLPTQYFYFLKEVIIRITDRLGHITFLKDMNNPYLTVSGSTKKLNDQQKIDHAVELLDKIDQPLFIHIHWMSTHGPLYNPADLVFSAGKSLDGQKNFEESFYLDSILEFDNAVQRLTSELETRKMLENTVLVIASDHSQRWSVSRLPLIFRFPGSENAGAVHSVTQNLDIAPTILQYIGIEQPGWMTGESVLSIEDDSRPIFIAAIPASKKDPKTGKVSYPDPVAPFYQFGKITLVSCNRYYLLNLETLKLNPGSVPQYLGECKNNEVNPGIAMKLISEFLVENGFDTSSLEKIEPGSQN